MLAQLDSSVFDLSPPPPLRRTPLTPFYAISLYRVPIPSFHDNLIRIFRFPIPLPSPPLALLYATFNASCFRIPIAFVC